MSRIEGFVDWSGDVVLDGECVIEANAVLRIAPDCRVRPSSGGAPPRFIVEGTLAAHGAPGRPVLLHASIRAAGGWVRLSRCRLSGDGGEGLHLFGDGHKIDEVSLSGFDTGLYLRDGTLVASEFTVAGGLAPVVVAAGGTLEWDGGAAPSQGLARRTIRAEGTLLARGAHGKALELETAIIVDGGRLELTDCRLNGGGVGLRLVGGSHRLDRVALAGYDCALSLSAGGQAILRNLELDRIDVGVRVDNGAAEIDGLRCRELAGPAVELLGDGYVSARGLRAPGGVAIAAKAGHVHVVDVPEGSVTTSSSVRLCFSPESVAVGRLPALRGFVLSTGRRPFFARLYKAAAAASVRCFAAWSQSQPRIAGAWVHRSWVAGGWEPGASDIDFALSVRELSSPASRRWLAKTEGFYAAARRVFPALGELLVAEDAHWRDALSSGLPRPREWPAQARILSGRFPTAPVPAPSPLGARLEAAIAYSRLMDACFHPQAPEELASREAAKSAVDVLRYLSPGEAPPRAEFHAALSPEWRERLRALEKPGRTHRAACALAAALTRVWSGSASSAPRGAMAPAASADIESARRDFDDAPCAAVFDTLHRSYLILDEDCPAETIAQGLAAWARRAAFSGVRQPLPIVLTSAGWTAWRATAYQDFPSTEAAWPSQGAPAVEHGGPGFRKERRVFWGDYAVEPPPPTDRAAALAQARAQFLLVRRLLAREARTSRAAAHHLLSRTAALALAAQGLPASDFDLDAAFSALASIAPLPAASLRRAAEGDWSEFESASQLLLAPSTNLHEFSRTGESS
jgi:hypothetical protein